MSATAADRGMTADEIIDAVIAAPDAWRRRVRSVTAEGSEEAAGAAANGGPVTQLEEDGGSVTAADAGELAADATPSPPVTRSAMRAAVAAAAQRRVSSG